MEISQFSAKTQQSFCLFLMHYAWQVVLNAEEVQAQRLVAIKISVSNMVKIFNFRQQIQAIFKIK